MVSWIGLLRAEALPQQAGIAAPAVLLLSVPQALLQVILHCCPQRLQAWGQWPPLVVLQLLLAVLLRWRQQQRQ